jgi:hypothetical protein
MRAQSGSGRIRAAGEVRPTERFLRALTKSSSTARLRRKLIDTSERGSASDDGCVGSRKSCQMMGGILVPWRLSGNSATNLGFYLTARFLRGIKCDAKLSAAMRTSLPAPPLRGLGVLTVPARTLLPRCHRRPRARRLLTPWPRFATRLAQQLSVASAIPLRTPGVRRYAGAATTCRPSVLAFRLSHCNSRALRCCSYTASPRSIQACPFVIKR